VQAVSTIGLDVAKSVFQVHGVDAAGQVVVRRQLKRRYVLAFFQVAAMPDRHRGLRLIAPLVA
jgi:transposase